MKVSYSNMLALCPSTGRSPDRLFFSTRPETGCHCSCISLCHQFQTGFRSLRLQLGLQDQHSYLLLRKHKQQKTPHTSVMNVNVCISGAWVGKQVGVQDWQSRLQMGVEPLHFPFGKHTRLLEPRIVYPE